MSFMVGVNRAFNNTEVFLSKAAWIPVIGTVTGGVKIVMGTVQAVMAVVSVIFTGIASLCLRDSSLLKYSWSHVKHGLGNICAGTFEAIPIIQQVLYCLREGRKSEAKENNYLLTGHEGKIMPYSVLIDLDCYINGTNATAEDLRSKLNELTPALGRYNRAKEMVATHFREQNDGLINDFRDKINNSDHIGAIQTAISKPSIIKGDDYDKLVQSINHLIITDFENSRDTILGAIRILPKEGKAVAIGVYYLKLIQIVNDEVGQQRSNRSNNTDVRVQRKNEESIYQRNRLTGGDIIRVIQSVCQGKKWIEQQKFCLSCVYQTLDTKLGERNYSSIVSALTTIMQEIEDELRKLHHLA